MSSLIENMVCGCNAPTLANTVFACMCICFAVGFNICEKFFFETVTIVLAGKIVEFDILKHGSNNTDVPCDILLILTGIEQTEFGGIIISFLARASPV